MSALTELRSLLAGGQSGGLAEGVVQQGLDSLHVVVRLESGVLRKVRCPQGAPGLGERVLVRGTELAGRVNGFTRKTAVIV